MSHRKLRLDLYHSRHSELGSESDGNRQILKQVQDDDGLILSAVLHVPMEKQWVFLSKTALETLAEPKNILGGKGAGLAQMTAAGLPVPPSFTISTEACNSYTPTKHFPKDMWEQTLIALGELEKDSGKKFGDEQNPLLVSVRSGARVSMPGMMDTVLNLGLNQKTLAGLAKKTNNRRFALDAYRRLIQMFGKIVMKIEGAKFEEIFNSVKEQTPGKKDTDLTETSLEKIVADFKKLYQKETGEIFPEDPLKQLDLAIRAVFDSWMGPNAITYRQFHKLSDDWGTAVNICTMVFGNTGEASGTGVAFTRNPATGEKKLYGEYLRNAQGEDVVAGIRTPKKIAELENEMPEIYKELQKVAQNLEKFYQDMQDMEFTIEDGKLWMLQTRTGKRTARAAIKIAVDLASEGLIDEKTAVMRVEPEQVDQLLHPHFDPEEKIKAEEDGKLLVRGLNASPGAATGMAVFDSDRAAETAASGEDVILVRPETSPDDVRGMLSSKGVLTQHGGATSHAAVVARGNNLPCVAGCEEIHIDLSKNEFRVGESIISEGDIISIDGGTGEVFGGAIPTRETSFKNEKDLVRLLDMADKFRKLGVKTNADYPADARKAREMGAEGIGLCRTEHMFFEEERRPIVVRMITAPNDKKRQQVLNELLPFQRADFEGIFEAMDGLPVVIRLIDPPMHEFLPAKDTLIKEVTQLECQSPNHPDYPVYKEKKALLETVERLWETNPMMGLRGCRAGLMYPGLTEMQVRAIFEAACLKTKEGIKVLPQIMIPLVSHVEELRREKAKLEKVAKEIIKEYNVKLDYKFGTMIEIPRAALTADEVASEAEFFSFGTNDLTQMTFGFSRDDAEGKFLLQYVTEGILPANPFQTLDQTGVGQLIQMAVEKGRGVKKDLEIGICGEHGGNPASIQFFHQAGLDYVSCSPYRVPVARLAAAQAALKP